MSLSLKGKITLNMWLLAAFCTLAAGALTSWILIKSQEQSIDEHLKTTASTMMSLGISDYSGLKGFEQLDTFIDEALKVGKIDQVIQIYTKRGKLMYSTIPKEKEGFSPQFVPSKAPEFRMVAVGNKKYKVLVSPYQAKTGKEYFLQTAMPAPSIKEILATTWNEAVLLFFALSLTALITAQVMSAKLVRPIRDIALYLSRIRPTEIKDLKPLKLSKPGDYLIEIASGVNALTHRIQASLATMNRTSRFLAHELRNPLTILSGEAEAVLAREVSGLADYREVLESSLEEIRRMNTVIDTVMKIYGKEKNTSRPAPCNLGAWLDENIPRWRKYLGKTLQWSRPEEDFVILVDTELLYRLLDNLLRNVKKHAGMASSVRLGLTRAGIGMELSCEDSGEGMEPELLSALNAGNTVFENIGIGLSLCLEIASICGFDLRFENKLTGGLKVVVLIPQSLTKS